MQGGSLTDRPEQQEPEPQVGENKVLAIAITIVGLTLVGLIIYAVLAVGNMISPPVFQSSESPNGTWIIEVRRAGAADADSDTILVFAKQKGEKYGQEVLRFGPDVQASIQWQDEDHLRIEWESDSAVIVGGARVTLPPPTGDGC